MHSSWFFRVKPIGRLFYEVRKIGKPYNFLPISITVLNYIEFCVGGSKLKTVLCNGYTMGTGGLPDICTRCPRAAGLRAGGAYIRQARAAGPRAEGVYIRQTMSAHDMTNIYHFLCVGKCSAQGFKLHCIYSRTYYIRLWV